MPVGPEEVGKYNSDKKTIEEIEEQIVFLIDYGLRVAIPRTGKTYSIFIDEIPSSSMNKEVETYIESTYKRIGWDVVLFDPDPETIQRLRESEEGELPTPTLFIFT